MTEAIHVIDPRSNEEQIHAADLEAQHAPQADESSPSVQVSRPVSVAEVVEKEVTETMKNIIGRILSITAMEKK